MIDPAPSGSSATLATLRSALLAVLVLGIAGLGAELFLLEHTEDVWQWIPIALLGAAVLGIGFHLVRPGRASIRTLQAIMLLIVASGLVGLALHYKGNVEFEREMYPGLAGFALFKMAMSGATPALAPGTMVLYGLLGLLYTFRHPSLPHGSRG
ncbi:MAG TPA: hypothetical protein VJ717_04220 [Gemmatimonadaceae bacterium]|nr:hypothetical protein [Gemmatimonadaceae bacterium]